MTLLPIAIALLTTLPNGVRTDTTFDVHSGARLSISDFAGDITVASWPRNSVRITADHSDRARILVAGSGPNIEVRGASRHGVPVRVDYNVLVPVWMPLILQGIYTDISVKDMKSEVSAETVKGEVRVEGGEGLVRASSVEGGVYVDGARGRLELNTVNEGVNVTGSRGDIVVNAINGDIQLDGIESGSVDASTVNGDVSYSGELRENGHYTLSTHDGDLSFGMPEKANATVQVSTFSGDFESAFPVQLDRTHRGKRFNFTLGTGSALVNLESFEGTIRLRRLSDMQEMLKLMQGKRVKLRELRMTEKAELEKELQKAKDKDKSKDPDQR